MVIDAQNITGRTQPWNAARYDETIARLICPYFYFAIIRRDLKVTATIDFYFAVT